MPRGDGRGPMGMGAMTGRGAGYCAGFATPGFANPMPGRGFGMAYGGGRGFGGRGRRAAGFCGWMMPFAAPAAPGFTPEAEQQMLKSQAESLQAELEFVRKRLSEIEVKEAE